MSKSSEMVQMFLEEVNGRLLELDAAFVQLQSSPDNKEIIHNIFKVFHQIVGLSDHLGFRQLNEVGVCGEKTLEKLRKGETAYSPELSMALFSVIEFIREQLKHIGETQREKEVPSEVASLLQDLESAM